MRAQVWNRLVDFLYCQEVMRIKKLLNTLYVLSEGNYLTLEGENVIIQNSNKTIARFPLHTFDNIVSFTYQGASPALMGACTEKNIGLSFFSPYGKYLCSLSGKSYGNVLLRKEQYRISDDIGRSYSYAKNMIIGKVNNTRIILERALRDHPYRIDTNKIKHVSEYMHEGIKRIDNCNDLDSLRGMEGEIASQYFSVFNEMIINQKETFVFSTRNRRPPLDPVNALLSFAYTILTNDCANALESVGLDPYVGFLHRDRPGRKSLALDLVEELRGVIADRFVLSIINLQIVHENHFFRQEDGAIILNEEGRKIFFGMWQSKKKEEIRHPFLEEKICWGLVPYVQALLLARTIRGDIEEYPPFLWR